MSCSDSSREQYVTMVTRGSVGSTIAGADPGTWSLVKQQLHHCTRFSDYKSGLMADYI